MITVNVEINMNAVDLKAMSKEDFMNLPNATEELYDALQKSKSGHITIQKISPCKDRIHSGYTGAFGEGLSVRMVNLDEWYVTSVIQSIDWEKHTFKTLNSIYEFKFNELN